MSFRVIFGELDVTARYRLDGVLGHGPTGPVHRAVPHRLGAPSMALRHLPVPAGPARARLRTRCETIAAAGHPGLVVVEDVVDVDDDTVAVVTPVAADGSLADRLVLGHLRVDEAAEVVARVADAVAAAHDVGLVHGRIHAGNVLLTGDGPVLADLAQGGAGPGAGGEPPTRTDVADLGHLALGLVSSADASGAAPAYRAVCGWAVDDADATAAAFADRLRALASPPPPPPAIPAAPVPATPAGDRALLGLVGAVAVAVGAGVGMLATWVPPTL